MKGYSFKQILWIMAIIIIVAPFTFYFFGFLAMPIAIIIDIVVKPDGSILTVVEIIIYLLKIIFGLIGAILVSKYLWPEKNDSQ